MTEQEHAETTSRPGAIVMSLAGIIELVISAILYGLQIYPAAIAFGIGALFVAMIANTIAGQGRAMQRRRGIVPPPETASARQTRQIGFYTAALLGTAAVAAAVMRMLGGDYLPAVAFGTWALCCAVFALRFH